MPSSSIPPPDLKGLAPYLKRAEELDRDNRDESSVVAYYCRQYAMELGIESRENAKDPETVSQFLLELIETLETAKSKMKVSRVEGEQMVYKLAIDIFSRADAEDRAGKASKSTARAFYAASVFMDTLKQFGNRGEDIDEKCRYAKWKAAEILKAFKEGRTPQPGPPGGLPPEEEEEATQENAGISLPKIDSAIVSDIIQEIPQVPVQAPPQEPPQEPPPTYDNIPSAPPAFKSPPVSAPRPMHQRAQSPPRSPYRRGSPSVSEQQLSDALEYARFAVAALEIKDTQLARERLQGALNALSS
mmetsp:Transcript_20813/g.26945  ORF Transcript_20813/g.26945 Transcript_20813/m.26945 type:complete len:302 (+) Transcript_20813:27-932(+)